MCRPLTATLPAASCSGRNHAAQRGERVRHRATILAAVHGVIERADLDRAVDNAAQRRDQGRLPDSPVRAVRNHDGVGLQQLLVGAEELGQVRRAGLLLAFDEDGDVERRLARPRLYGRHVHGDPGLVVGRAPPEQAPAAFGRLERGRVPQVGGTGRLHVMVGIEQEPGDPAGPRIVPYTAGWEPPTSSSLASRNPDPLSHAAVARAERRTCPASNPAALTEGMRTSRSSSLRRRGNADSTAARAAAGFSSAGKSRPSAPPAVAAPPPLRHTADALTAPHPCTIRISRHSINESML